MPQPTLDVEQRATEEPNVEQTPRRKFFFLGALAAAALLPGAAGAQVRSRRRRPAEPVELPIANPGDPSGAIAPNENVAAFAEWDTGGLTRLVRRVTLGITPGEVTRVKSLDWNGYLNYQLNYTRIKDDALDTILTQRYPLISQSSDTLFSSDAG